MALVGAEIDEEWNVQSIDFLEKINLLNHCKCRNAECTVCQSRRYCAIRKLAMDGLFHVIRDHQALFDRADVVIIEKQPLQGMTDIEGVLYSRFIEKVNLIMPRRMHGFLGIVDLNYDERKDKTEEYATALLDRLAPEETRTRYEGLTRKHDVADAICFIACFADYCRKWHPKKKPNLFAKFSYKLSA